MFISKEEKRMVLNIFKIQSATTSKVIHTLKIEVVNADDYHVESYGSHKKSVDAQEYFHELIERNAEFFRKCLAH